MPWASLLQHSAMIVQKIRIGVDSGAEVIVWPIHLCSHVPTVKDKLAGTGYWAPGDHEEPSIVDQGHRCYELERRDHASLIFHPRIAPVRGPLVSVADMNDRD